jgi:serine/threonine protein kinase
MTIIAIPGLHIERMIAQGGIARVYLAEQTSLGRKVAVKVLDPRASDPEFADRFFYEARLVATLHHHNIITIHDFGTLDDGKIFLSMEYFPGGDLEQRLRKGVMAEKDILRILKELARGLNFIHQKGIIHRDIKPANLLFREDGSLVLTDFGIAHEKQNDPAGMVQDGTTLGSPAYSSPEQAQGKTLDQRSDIYSVGVVLYEMFSRINPFRADNYRNTALNHMQMPPPPLPAGFLRYQPMIEKMLAKHPEGRFNSMLEILEFIDNMAATARDAVTAGLSASSPSHAATTIPPEPLPENKSAAQRSVAEQHLQKVKDSVHRRIKARVAGEQLPAPVAMFLLYPWFDYLTSVMLRNGEQSETWQQGVQLVDNLLWSIKPKSSAHEINRLQNLRETLQQQMRKGLDTIGYDQRRSEDLLKKIAALQDAILQPAPRATVTTPEEKTLAGQLQLLMEPGTWFKFTGKDRNETQTLKVAWRDNNSGNYVLVNDAGKPVLTLSAQELAQRLLAKSARVIAGTPKPQLEEMLESLHNTSKDE